MQRTGITVFGFSSVDFREKRPELSYWGVWNQTSEEDTFPGTSGGFQRAGEQNNRDAIAVPCRL